MTNKCATINATLNTNNNLTNVENFDESEITNNENSNDVSTPASSTNEIEKLEKSTGSILKLTSKIKRPKEYNDKEWEAEAVYYLYINSSTNSLRSNANSNIDNFITYQPLINGFSRNSNSYTSLTSLDTTLEKRPNRKKKRGFAYRSRIDSEYKCFQDHAEVCYRLGDHVFVETFQPTEPYFIGCINQFKMNKREQLYVKLARYYRPNDVPEMSYSLIIQDRIDQGHFSEAIRCVQSRELFSSDTVAIFPVSQLRGKCKVKLVKDIRAILTVPLSSHNNNNFLNISTSNGIYQNENICLNDIKNNFNNSLLKEKDTKHDLITKKTAFNNCCCSSNGKRSLNKANVSIATTNSEKISNQTKKKENCSSIEICANAENSKDLKLYYLNKNNSDTSKNCLLTKNLNKIDCEVPLCFVSASGSSTSCVGCCEITETLAKKIDNNCFQPEVLELLKEEDTFFTCLNFNQENNRLASFAGEIRVGASFQAKLPAPAISSMCDEPDRDELLYRPGHLCHESEMNYVKAARTFRSFKVNCNKQMTSIEKAARIGDLLMDKALITLHHCGYNIKNALEKMRENDENLDFECSYFNIEDVKKFGKGIKTSGKNFNKINRELLPHYTRDQLVNFYYLWKRSRDAIRPRPLGRQKNPTVAAVSGVGRRGANGKTNNGNNSSFNRSVGSPNGNSTKNYGPKLNAVLVNGVPNYEELIDYASASDTELENFDGIQRACHHCFTMKSRNWHHAGRNRLLMCESCRLFYKKYADLKQVDRPSTVPLCLSKASVLSPQSNKDENENDATSTYSIKTRGAIGRKERRQRTPTILDVYGSTGGTPVRNDTYLTENLTPERRLTPQRNAKSKKRLHRGSSSGNVESTPCLRSKRSKTDSITPSPSPTLLCGNVDKINDMLVSAESAEKNLNNSSLNFADDLALSLMKKEFVDKSSSSLSTENNLNFEVIKSPNNSATVNNSTKTLSVTPTMARIKPEIKKPIAKVEPLDPNESVKDSVKSAFSISTKFNKTEEKINENALIKLNSNSSDNKIITENQQLKENIEKMEIDDKEPSISRSITPVNHTLNSVNEDDQQQNEECEDASLLGTEDNSPLELIKEKDGCVDTVIHRFLKRRLKRLSQVTCARTDISVDDTYAQKITEEWRRKQKQQQQQIAEQQKQNQTLSISSLNNLSGCGTNGSLTLQQRQQQEQQQVTAMSVTTNNCLSSHQQQISSSRKPSEIINHSFENNTTNIIEANAALRAAALFNSNQNINGIPSTAALAALTAVHQQQQQQSNNQLPPNAAAMAAAMQNMAQVYPRIAAMFAVNQQAVIATMVANFEQQQKIELRRQQQLQQQTSHSQQQRHQINGAASKHQQRSNATTQKNSLSGVSLPTATSEVTQTPFMAASTLEQQRLSFFNSFNQQQAILAQHQNHQQQQSILGFPTTLTELAMLIDRDGVDQRALLERLQLEYHQQQLQQQQQTNQNNISATNNQQQQLQQQLLLAATMGNPMLGTAGIADSKQLQTFLSIIQQQQAALQQQQAQHQQQAAAAAVVAQQKQQQLQAAVAAVHQQPQQQQQKQAQQQQQLLAAMTNSLPPQFQQQMAQLMQQHQQQQIAEIMRRFQQEQQTSGNGGRQ